MKTINEVAAAIGLSASRVRQLCLAHKIGVRRGNMRFLTAADVRAVQAARNPIGRPKKFDEKSIDKPKRSR